MSRSTRARPCASQPSASWTNCPIGLGSGVPRRRSTRSPCSAPAAGRCSPWPTNAHTRAARSRTECSRGSRSFARCTRFRFDSRSGACDQPGAVPSPTYPVEVIGRDSSASGVPVAMLNGVLALSLATATTRLLSDGHRTHCPYCAFQCGTSGSRVTTGQSRRIEGDPDFPVNAGRLCVKGWTAGELLKHPDRLLTPLVRERTVASQRAGTRRSMHRGRLPPHPGAARRRRDRRVRLRCTDEREGVSAREVRPRRPPHSAHRLQRPLLHVERRRRREQGVRNRPRAALPRQ